MTGFHGSRSGVSHSRFDTTALHWNALILAEQG